jgi:hypothetical protein
MGNSILVNTKTLYTSLEQMQADLGAYMNKYNTERTNQGKRCQGRTPKQTWDDGCELYQKYVLFLKASSNFAEITEDRPSWSSSDQWKNPHEDEAPRTQNFQNPREEMTNENVLS